MRTVKFNDGRGGLLYGEGSYGEARWRTEHSLQRNGELYPMHGLGPIATWMDMNRGNRLTSLTSHATKSRSLKHFAKQHPDGGPNHPYATKEWKLGDVVTSTITTARGETIILTHDTNSPRPYSLGFRIQGVQGLAEFDYYTQRVHIEGVSENHRWDAGSEWFDKYDHPLWKQYGEEAANSGHGGMDFFLDRAFIEGVRRQEAPVIDVYDGAVMRVITPLSERSIIEGGAPQEIPDFTQGAWMHRAPVFGLGISKLTMQSISLVILAAGLGSRYGGQKQTDGLGPNQESLLDYAIYDGLKAGFTQIVFVVRESMMPTFKEALEARWGRYKNKYYPKAYFECVLQKMDDLPEGCERPVERTKPWGTAHALWAARECIHEPFAMINADDFYGCDALLCIAQHLKGSKTIPYTPVWLDIRSLVPFRKMVPSLEVFVKLGAAIYAESLNEPI